jgi:REP element-mobilizing transposase RayT
MPRGPRRDYPGALHHVFNRGLAKRPILENARDMRLFQALLAKQVRAGLLEVHAFSLLTTHYHLLVGSPLGRISDAMWAIENLYVRRFNIARRRDGPLLRGRFGSRLCESSAYFEALVRYIDRNPVSAGIVVAPQDHRYGSARHFATEGRQGHPPWLRRDVVERMVCDVTSRDAFAPDAYVRFAGGPARAAIEIVEARMNRGAVDAPDPLDDLVRGAPIRIQRWMEQKARLADGTTPGVVVLSARTLLAVVEEQGIPDPQKGRLLAGLLRDLAGLRVHEIAARLQRSHGAAYGDVRRHRESLGTDAAYAALAAEIVHAVLRRDFGPPGRTFEFPRRPMDGGVIGSASDVELPQNVDK